MEMLRFILVFLDTQSWVENEDSEADDLSELFAAVEYITSHFRQPLEAVSANLASIQDEVEEAVDYARKYKVNHTKRSGTSSMYLLTQSSGLMFLSPV